MKAKIWKFSGWLTEKNPAELRGKINWLLEEAGFGILSVNEHNSEPFGYSCFWLLSKSHCAIHTFPEESATYIELSSCVENYQIAFKSLYNRIFETKCIDVSENNAHTAPHSHYTNVLVNKSGKGKIIKQSFKKVEIISFDEFVEYGLNNCDNVNNGAPWSFNFKGYPVTHENDECYLITTPVEVIRFTPDKTLLTDGENITLIDLKPE